MVHGGGKTVVLNVNVAVEAVGAIDANFTTGIETVGSCMASEHQKPTEGTRAELESSTGVGSPVRASTQIGVGSTVAPNVCQSWDISGNSSTLSSEGQQSQHIW